MNIQVADRIHAFLWDSMTENNCNTYLVDGPVRVLIDPGHARLFDHVRDGLEALGIGLDDIGLVICTHAHPDHLEAVTLFADTSAKFAMHQDEWEMLSGMGDMIRQRFGIEPESFAPDIFLTEGKLSAGDVEMDVILTPGHSPGGICLHLPEQGALFTGDVVFRQGIGRADLPGADPGALRQSIRRLSRIEVELMLPGHGDIITGQDEVRRNFQSIQAMGW